MSGTKKGLVMSISVGAAMVIANAMGNFSANMDFSQLIGWLSDCFAVPGMLLTGAGVLILIAEGGFFDIFSYSIKKLVSGRDFGGGYVEYKCRREKKRLAYSQTLFVGLFFLFASVILCFVYEMAV